MKKILLLITILFLSFSLFAQNTNEFNRFLLHHTDGSTKGFVMGNIDSLTFMPLGNNTIANININGVAQTYNTKNIDSISFAAVKGRVAADINIIDYDLTTVILDIVRTPSCSTFRITCVPASTIDYLDDATITKYVDANAPHLYNQDYYNTEFLGLELEPATEYVILSVAYDKYGILCELDKEKFLTPSEDLVGNPKVEVEIVENNLYDFTLKFIPNDDVSRYSVIIGEAGAIENQFIMFGASFGWSDMGDMIEDWGIEFTNQETYQWTEKSPNTYYDVFIQARDLENNRAPYKLFKFKTKSLGGDGVAEVEISLGEYKLNDWYGEMLPSQFITFTPNEHTSAYRINVVLAENYNSDPEGYKEDLCSEPFMPTDGWFQFETLTTDFQIDPNTECVAIAAAKNINGEWGPVAELRFTTPAEIGGKSYASSGNIMQRFNHAGKSQEETKFIDEMMPLNLK